jgi:acyl-CoA thioester hydrolase
MGDFVHRLEVRFRDCDPMGHVNHSVYFTYLEQTRFAHWRALGGRPSGEEAIPSVIIAHAECDYKRAALQGEVLEVRLRLGSMGRSSFQYEYEIVDEQQRTIATAKTVQVMYDYRAGRPIPIPDEIRQRLQASPARQP